MCVIVIYLEISVDDPILMQVRQTIQQLPHHTFDDIRVHVTCDKSDSVTSDGRPIAGALVIWQTFGQWLVP